MACLGIFGRGPMGGGVTAPHLRALKDTPAILADIYLLAGIVVNTPVTLGPANFRLGGAGANDESFVCPDAFCRRCLPVYVAQLDHNVPQAQLIAPNLGMPHVAPAYINGRNFVNRPGTNSNQHTNNAFNPGGGGAHAGFAIYYTFGLDVFDLVMEAGGNAWFARILRGNRAALHNLVLGGFNLAPAVGFPNCFDFVAVPGGPAIGAGLGRLTPTLLANYAGNLAPENDLANLQFLCGPCNATKNAGGVPLACATLF